MGKFKRSSSSSSRTSHVPNMAFCLLLALSRSGLIMAQLLPPPTNPPTNAPNTTAPVLMPTGEPINTDSPTPAPFVTEEPTVAPITNEPTDAPVTNEPTDAPITSEPTDAPVTGSPTVAPVTTTPTLAPVTGTPTDAPVTASPTSVPVTESPTAAPVTATPTVAPVTASPTAAPVAATPAPTTPGPTTAAPTTTAPTTPKPTSAAPTRAPTSAPTSPTYAPTETVTTPPTLTPSLVPSVLPTTLKPTTTPSMSPSSTGTLPPTSSPSYIPSASVTQTPSLSPSSAEPVSSKPSAAPVASGETSAPTIKVDKTTSGLTITLGGIDKVEDTASWSKSTTEFFTTQYEESGKMTGIAVEVTLTSQKSNNGRRNTRGLQTASVEITYEQALAYSTSDASLTLNEALKLPLETPTQQDEYIATLKGLDGYSDLTSVTSISVPANIEPTPNPDTGGVPQWAIIVIILISVLALVVLFLIVLRKRRGARNAEGYHPDEPTYEQSGLGSFSQPPTFGDETVETMDYDYAKAYGGGDASLSEAGGTLGSRPAAQAGNNTIFSDDPTFNEAYDGGHEEVIDIYAPSGKLGVVIDTPNDDAPIVHAVKDSSPIANQVRVGDKLVAVDDEDVRAMTAIKVSKLISKKSTQESRKLTIIRYVSGN